jgi:hypothetical protein
MSRPKTARADELLGEMKHQDWGKLRRRMHEAIRRNDGPTPRRDGLRRAGDGTGVSGGGVSDPTYSAAMSREELDRVRTHTRLAARHLENAVLEVRAFVEQLEAVEQLANDADLNPEPICWAMARVGSVEPVWRTGDVGGRLKESRPLGKWAYEFVMAMGRAPAAEECRARAEGRRVRVRAS